MAGFRTIIPLSDFKANINLWLEKLAKDQEPIVVTRRGRGLFVVQLPVLYERIERMALDAQHQYALNQALQDVDIDTAAGVKRC